ncbi:23S rRNA (uridine(2552)-2'-O)-methyltransferase RlmE [Chitinimonas sp. BJYL2]|uniref:23S rRNA (uridine(2552)-2'-O)-methyltransferase RlmE n=1 Tax=Chitinimonas sp. BJYL2 TaxID=2976696 RepID=UPI0022B54A2F|nr:23S rRNA (uridine(2552)-2'-O)-methyltransferase RlmE [Chitinimonas sp. BJYL2]
MARSKTSKGWLQEHVNDTYVQRAQKDGYRARAAYKLLEIDDKDKLLKSGLWVADLGAAPGSWSQVARRRVGDAGRVFALDILDMPPIAGVEFIQGDFREDTVLQQFTDLLGGRLVDLVICDMAPNMSGMAVTDQARSFLLCELALDFCRDWLKPGGHFLVKTFQGSGYTEYLQQMRETFQTVVTRKPAASRDRSAEIYLLGKGKKP